MYSWRNGLISLILTVGSDIESLSHLSNTFKLKAFGEDSVYVNYEAERDFLLPLDR